MSEPLISVVVPVYGVEPYLKKCVDTLLAQTYQNLEIILVDDGSPDLCPSICDYYASKYGNVKTFHKPNGGLSDARNYGTAQASADWIVYVDSDDYVSSCYISDLWNLRSRFNADIAMAWVIREDANGCILGKKKTFDGFCLTGESAIFEVYGKGVHVGWNAYNKIYRKQVLLDNPFPNGYYEDMACMYKILERCAKVAIGDFSQNYHYVQRPNSILNGSLTDKHFHIFDICKDFSTYIKTQYPNYSVLEPIVYAKAVIQMLGSSMICKTDFDNVFIKYRKLFLRNILSVVFAKGINYRFKILYTMLCTTPSLYRIMHR